MYECSLDTSSKHKSKTTLCDGCTIVHETHPIDVHRSVEGNGKTETERERDMMCVRERVNTLNKITSF